MHRPVLVTPATELPASVEDVKLALRIDGNDLDTEIESQIRAAVDHYQGWTGILGIAIAESGWRQDYDRFCRDLKLFVGPVKPSGFEVTYRNAAGQISTVATGDYALRYDLSGTASIRFNSDYSFPSDLHEYAAVSVTYTAGYATVPDDIKSAIKLRVQMMIDEAAQSNMQYLVNAENALIGKYRRMAV